MLLDVALPEVLLLDADGGGSVLEFDRGCLAAREADVLAAVAQRRADQSAPGGQESCCGRNGGSWQAGEKSPRRTFTRCPDN